MAEQTILESIRANNEIDSSDEGFDGDLVIAIDGFLADLHQVGVGVEFIDVNGKLVPPRVRRKKDLTWNEFFGGENTAAEDEAIKYVALKVKLMFNPPLPATINWYEKAADEAIWRARLEFDK